MTATDKVLVLYLEHRASLVNYAAGIVHDRASAEDVVQEAWLRFSSAAAAPRGDHEISQPVNYLYRVVRNLALDWTNRASSRMAVKSSADDLEGIEHDAPTAENVLVFRDELRVLRQALAELPQRTRTAFEMVRLDGRTLQEVARHLGISVPRAHQLVAEAIVHTSRRLDEASGDL